MAYIKAERLELLMNIMTAGYETNMPPQIVAILLEAENITPEETLALQEMVMAELGATEQGTFDA